MLGTMSTRQYPHFDRVDSSGIRARFSDLQNPEFRYLLEVPYSERTGNDVVCVVLKNPSVADESRADPTINNVEKYIWCKFRECKKIYILNLFAYRSTDIEGLWSRMDNGDVVGPDNDHYLRCSFSMSTHIIGAWGQPTNHGSANRLTNYCRRITQVLELLQPYAGKLRQVHGDPAPTTGNWFPLHGKMWKVNQDLIEWRP